MSDIVVPELMFTVQFIGHIEPPYRDAEDECQCPQCQKPYYGTCHGGTWGFSGRPEILGPLRTQRRLNASKERARQRGDSKKIL